MPKGKLKNEFVVRVAPGSDWYYVLSARSLKKLKAVSEAQDV